MISNSVKMFHNMYSFEFQSRGINSSLNKGGAWMSTLLDPVIDFVGTKVMRRY